MRLRRLIPPLALFALLVLCWRAWGWPGLVAGAGAALLWLLLHFTRLMQVMRRAAERPVGTVASAVMLNARLAQGVNLLHVVALTRSLGECLSAEGASTEIYRWRDASGTQVRCEFEGGRLLRWQLLRQGAAES
ncbi:MAG: glycerate kinase [Comamonas sp. SCN 65-56]|uniref:glycerate kinase n=1 Tax=Comamonas sp. SCN 65-56 TaxID=1660095 RepID=UPI0008686DEB|nr:glycerate kinase [Comamonas sp. SCN 65-56]ODS93040.1 MAG: glycerate kinase [Comamonas sp. SCN 65-56]